MRLAIVNSHRSIVGGIETYLRLLVPALAERGHELAFLHEAAAAAGHELITLPEGAPIWSVSQLGAERAINALRQWKPDIIYAHGMRLPELEEEIQTIAPAVFFAHAYYGSCVSGAKAFSYPVPRPCGRKFGWQCLVHYYPRRCGGLNPGTMLHNYRLQAKRLSLLRNYGAIIVASSHMAREYEKYDLAERIKVITLPVNMAEKDEPPQQSAWPKQKWQILFLGRMDFLKGAMTLLDAVPAVARQTDLKVNITFGGAGQMQRELEQRAAHLVTAYSNLEINFTGWLDAKGCGQVLSESDLLVIPSLLPEPFGLVGLEAGLYGVPVVAFAVGGIPDWLKDGVNGALASGNPPRAEDLSTAIARCLGDQSFYQKLRRGAREQAEQFSMQAHLASLLLVLERVADAEGI